MHEFINWLGFALVSQVVPLAQLQMFQTIDRILTHNHVDDVKSEYVDGEQGEGQGEQVEVPVVPLAHTVAHPWTVVIKTVWKRRKQSPLIIQNVQF